TIYTFIRSTSSVVPPPPASTLFPYTSLFRSPVLGALTGAVSPLAAAIIAAVTVSPEFRDLLLGLFDALRPLLPIIAETGIELAGTFSAGLGAVATVLRPLVPAVEGLVSVFTALPEPLQQATIAMLAFSLAMRAAAAHPIGATVTAAVGGILPLGTAMESLTAVFGKAQPATQAWQSTVQETTEDLLRLARTGRTTGDLKSLTPMFFDLADGLKTANTELNFLERELSGMA